MDILSKILLEEFNIDPQLFTLDELFNIYYNSHDTFTKYQQDKNNKTRNNLLDVIVSSLILNGSNNIGSDKVTVER